jgi:hypothetical protein
VPRIKEGRKRGSRKTGPTRSPFRPVAVVTEPKPARGMKLKTVSRFTLLFALLCLGAFLAGRPPMPKDAIIASAQRRAKQVRAEQEALRNDNAGRVLFSLRR